MYRCSSSLAFWFDDDRIVVTNYRQGSMFRCSAEWAVILAKTTSPVSREELFGMLRSRGVRDCEAIVDRFVQRGVLLETGTHSEVVDTSWRQSWKWGPVAGLFHYATKNVPWATLEQEEEIFRQIADEEAESVAPLWENHSQSDDSIRLPKASTRSFLALAARRVTCREFNGDNIPLDGLAACLYAGVGFRGSLDLPQGRLPLKLTPSGGARNPFECYLLVRVVEGLEPGIYHYSGPDHSLRRETEKRVPKFSTVLSNQEWSDDASAVILLVARLERVMQMYRKPSAYSNVLIEAGHIAQNIILAATESGIGSAPVIALDHDLAEEIVGATDALHSAIYAVALGIPQDSTHVEVSG